MTRGDQRDRAREKNRKKMEKAGKGKKEESGASFTKRKESDAEIMREKQKVNRLVYLIKR
ncbi:hypothetical protein BDF19DRAFT_448393 [Syncephalis fuscata]|nr:hypothetical protein BDF19DRAFT_448393 [Syncephalis fuscata]